MAALREVFAHFGFSFDRAGLDKAEAATDKSARKIDSRLSGVAAGVQAAFAGVVGGAVVGSLNHMAEELDVFDQLSQQTKISTTDLQALGLAATQNGSSVEEMAGALTLLQRGLGSVDAGAAGQTSAFAKLGIRTKDASGETRDLNSVLPEVFENFSGLASQAEKTAVANQLFGRSGVRLVPLLEQGTSGLEGMRDALAAVGGGASKEAIESAGKYRNALNRMQFSLFSLKGVIATQVFPVLERLVGSMSGGIGKLSQWVSETTLVKNGAIALAGVLGFTLLKALGPYLLPGLKLAGIFLAIDDVMAFLDGKDSVIGALLNNVFGPGSATRAREWINNTIGDFKKFFSDMLADTGEFGDNIVGMFQSIWDDIKTAFADATGFSMMSDLLSDAVGLERSKSGNRTVVGPDGKTRVQRTRERSSEEFVGRATERRALPADPAELAAFTALAFAPQPGGGGRGDVNTTNTVQVQAPINYFAAPGGAKDDKAVSEAIARSVQQQWRETVAAAEKQKARAAEEALTAFGPAKPKGFFD